MLPKEDADFVKHGMLEGCNSRKIGLTLTKWRLNKQGQEFRSQKGRYRFWNMRAFAGGNGNVTSKDSSTTNSKLCHWYPTSRMNSAHWWAEVWVGHHQSFMTFPVHLVHFLGRCRPLYCKHPVAHFEPSFSDVTRLGRDPIKPHAASHLPENLPYIWGTWRRSSGVWSGTQVAEATSSYTATCWCEKLRMGKIKPIRATSLMLCPRQWWCQIARPSWRWN